MNTKQNIITFREFLLPPSETFIENQTSSLSCYSNYYAGIKIVKTGLTPLTSPVIVINNNNLRGKLKEILFKQTGCLPRSYINKLKSLNPKLCHAHFGPDGIYALAISKHLKIPLIVTFHGYDATSLNNDLGKKNHKQITYLKKRSDLIKYTSIFIAVSKFIKNKLIHSGFPERKILVHYIGIDTKFYSIDKTIKREKIILFVGRLVEKKGCSYLIKAFSKLSIKYPDYKLIIIGDGPLKMELQNLAEIKNINCNFLGYQNSKSIKIWMNKSMVFCVPSITAQNGDAEGFGIVFIEAQAMGTPVVSFKSGGIVESVLNKKTGLLAKEKDWKQLKIYLELLISDPIQWKKFSLEGRKYVTTNFDLSKQTKKLEAIYAKILSED